MFRDSVQVLYQSNPRGRCFVGHIGVLCPHLVVRGIFPSVTHVCRPRIAIGLLGFSDVVHEFVYLPLESVLLSGFGGEGPHAARGLGKPLTLCAFGACRLHCRVLCGVSVRWSRVHRLG